MPLWSTDNPLVDTVDYVQAIHVNEIRTALNTGWLPCNTWTFGTFSTPSGLPPQLTVSLTGDARADMDVGDKIKFTLSSTVYYAYLSVISFSSGSTTLTFLFDKSVSSLSSGTISANYYAKVPRPNGFPYWLNYTPTNPTYGTMTFTSTTLAIAKFAIIGGEAHVAYRVTGTTGGTADIAIRFSLPINGADSTNVSRFVSGAFYDNGSGLQGSAFGWMENNASPNYTTVYKYNQGLWSLSAGNLIDVRGFYSV